MAYYMRAEVYKKLGYTREAVWDCIKFLGRNYSSGTVSESFGLLDVLKLGIGVAGINVSNLVEAVGTVKDAVGTEKEAADSASFVMKKSKAEQEIIAFGVPRLLDELIEGYSPERIYDDASFYNLALRWLENNSPEKGYYIGFVQLLLKNFNEAIQGFDSAITNNPENPNPYYFRGIAFIKKMEKTGNMETSTASKGSYLDFIQALKNGFKWRICPGCGYKTDSKLNYCMLCGKRLLV